MDYLDTSFILSLAVKSDVNHERAILLGRQIDDPVISKLVLVELYSVFSRLSDEPEPMVEYSLRRADAELKEADLNEAAELAILMASELKLRTLDLLHASLAKLIGAERFVTLDDDILKKGLSPLGIEVLGGYQ